jgi:hypothetical protein
MLTRRQLLGGLAGCVPLIGMMKILEEKSIEEILKDKIDLFSIILFKTNDTYNFTNDDAGTIKVMAFYKVKLNDYTLNDNGCYTLDVQDEFSDNGLFYSKRYVLENVPINNFQFLVDSSNPNDRLKYNDAIVENYKKTRSYKKITNNGQV